MATKERWVWSCGYRRGTGMDRESCFAGPYMPVATEAEARSQLMLHFSKSGCNNRGDHPHVGSVRKLRKGERWHPTRKDRSITVDFRKGSPTEICPFCKEHVDYDGDGTGDGECYVAQRLWNEELPCPQMGPKGGYTGKPPKTCPLMRGDVTVEKGKVK